MKFIVVFLVLLSGVSRASVERVRIGSHQVRGLLQIVRGEGDSSKRPLVVLFPGSGAMGPEVRFPGFVPDSGGGRRQITTDGQDHSIFEDLAAALNQGGVSTLAVGKPGVDFSEDGVFPAPFYDKALFDSLEWPDWVATAKDAVEYARGLPGVDPDRVYVLGHSESTQMVVDYAQTDSRLAGVILLGVVNDNFATSDAYQIFEDEIENFIARDVDADHDGFIDRVEAARWPVDFKWEWREGQGRVAVSEIAASKRTDPRLQRQYEQAVFKFREAIYRRPSTLGSILASLKMSVDVFNGERDVMTVPRQALAIERECRKARKENCHVTIVPGLGHAFSAPLQPRAQPFLDWSFGPVDPQFRALLRELGSRL